MGKGLKWLFVGLLLGVLIGAMVNAFGAVVPPNALVYAPVLVSEQRSVWPQMPEPWTLGGLVEQESCIRLTHPKCWNPRAELKTPREYGFGFGQITVAYQTDGSERFNKFNELRAQQPALKDWTWDNRYDPAFQLRAIVLMNRANWSKIPPAATVSDHLAFMLSGYNGGVGAVRQDRILCSNTPGCDSGRWFGNVELNSVKSRVPQALYGGKSWFSINREYVRNVMNLRRAKYKSFWEES